MEYADDTARRLGFRIALPEDRVVFMHSINNPVGSGYGTAIKGGSGPGRAALRVLEAFH